MTTYVLFQPSPLAPFSFQATLDGNPYIITIPWLLSGQRWYVQCQDTSGNLVFYLPLIGSPSGIGIENITWSLGTVTIQTQNPHGYAVGATIYLTVSGVSPSGYNGTYECLITSPTNITYDISDYPGQVSNVGSISYDINIADGYFTTSTLVFRDSSQTFEINP